MPPDTQNQTKLVKLLPEIISYKHTKYLSRTMSKSLISVEFKVTSFAYRKIRGGRSSPPVRGVGGKSSNIAFQD